MLSINIKNAKSPPTSILWSIVEDFYVPSILFWFLCLWIQAEHPCLLFALGLVNLVNGLISTKLMHTEKAQTTAISLTRFSTTPSNLWMKSTLMRNSNSYMFLLVYSLSRCWFGERILANITCEIVASRSKRSTCHSKTQLQRYIIFI